MSCARCSRIGPAASLSVSKAPASSSVRRTGPSRPIDRSIGCERPASGRSMTTATRGVLIGSNGGLFQLLNGTLTAVPGPCFPSTDVRNLLRDRQGRLWVGTSRGLVRLDGGRCQPVRAASGEPGRFITAIYQDERDEMWVGSMAGGLSRVRGDALVAVRLAGAEHAAAGRERHYRLSRDDVGQHRRDGLAHPRQHGGALRSAQRPSQRQGLCDSGRRARHDVDDVEQGPARRQDRRPRRVCRRPSLHPAVAAVRSVRRDGQRGVHAGGSGRRAAGRRHALVLDHRRRRAGRPGALAVQQPGAAGPRRGDHRQRARDGGEQRD